MKQIVHPAAATPAVATIGFFDGVHRGHRYLIEQVCEAAAERGLASAVVTFPIHPRRVMQSDFHPQLLTTCDEKVRLLERAGIDACIMMDFTPQLAALSARQFMALLKEQYRIEALVIGYDHRFGHNRAEGFAEYAAYGRELGMEVLPARAYYLNRSEGQGAGSDVSSSGIRRLLQAGDVKAAAQALGYRYFLQGRVVGGYRVGHRIGFPTANLCVNNPDKLIPADGVYAVWADVDGHRYGGMLCIGTRPTLANGSDRSIEVHLFDFQADIYERPLTLSFVQRTRDEQKFASVDLLVAQLHRDECEIRALLQRL
ncbi:MAG: bifunctional riboflavin kinase/FAD synthetase [Mediterranea sp.]|nr:bifunctional riboflavin kinase/FAD synthetase [Mediterranea sp.]